MTRRTTTSHAIASRLRFVLLGFMRQLRAVPDRRMIQQFEKAARIDEMKPSTLIHRKKALTSQLAECEQKLRQHINAIEKKKALTSGANYMGQAGSITPAPEIVHSQYDSAPLLCFSSSERL